MNQGIVPFDSSYYYYVCRGCRIPHEECDELVCDDTARHIVVLRRGKYYKVEVIDRKGNILSKCQLKEKLQYIINLAGDLDDDRPIAGLTAQERTIWAKVAMHAFVFKWDDLKYKSILKNHLLIVFDYKLSLCSKEWKNVTKVQSKDFCLKYYEPKSYI